MVGGTLSGVRTKILLALAVLTVTLVGGYGSASGQVSGDPLVQEIADRLNALDITVSQGVGFRCGRVYSDLRPHPPMSDYTDQRVRCVDSTRIETFANDNDKAAYEDARRDYVCMIPGNRDAYVSGDLWVVGPPRSNMSLQVAQMMGEGYVSYTCP